MRANGWALALVALAGVGYRTTEPSGTGAAPAVAPSVGSPAPAPAVKRALAIRASGSGAVAGCTATCAQLLDEGQSVHLVAVPQAGFASTAGTAIAPARARAT